MDRCRCDDYKAAVDKLKFFTVGTLRPDIIENYNRGDFRVHWVKKGIDYEDLRFRKPKAVCFTPERPDKTSLNQMSEHTKKLEHMWCKYMTPVKRTPPRPLKKKT